MAERKLQVFVSSTFSDLQDIRQAAVAAILKAGHIPAGMELFTSGDTSQMDVIKRWIEESDVYMLLLGGRYGSIEPTTGLAYTELEYDYAVSLGKPFFAVVLTEAAINRRVTEFGKVVLELENPSQLKDFQNKALSRMSSFCEDAKDVKLGVYESLGELAGRPDLIGWVRSSELQRITEQAAIIANLKDQITKLEVLLETEKNQPKQKVTAADDFLKLAKLLESVEVILPEDVRGEGPEKNSLLNLFSGNQVHLIAGVTNSPFNEASGNFLYYNIATKLKVHGLMREKRLVGRKLDCLATSPRGDQFLAWLDRRKSELKKSEVSEI